MVKGFQNKAMVKYQGALDTAREVVSLLERFISGDKSISVAELSEGLGVPSNYFTNHSYRQGSFVRNILGVSSDMVEELFQASRTPLELLLTDIYGITGYSAKGISKAMVVAPFTQEGTPLNQEEVAEQLLSALEDGRLREIVEKYYAFYDGRSWTLQEIGDSMGLSRERVRVLLGKALTTLKHREVLLSYSDMLDSALEGVCGAQLGYYRGQVDSLEANLLMVQRENAKLQKEVSALRERLVAVPTVTLPSTIEGFRFSNRVSKALQKHGIRTVEQLLNMEALELRSWRGFGATSLREVNTTLARYGVSLKGSGSSYVKVEGEKVVDLYEKVK